MEGIVLVELHSGALVYCKSFSSNFDILHGKSDRINLASLLFALHNFAGDSIIPVNTKNAPMTTNSFRRQTTFMESSAPYISMIENPMERLVFAKAPNCGLLMVFFTSPLLHVGLAKSIAQRLAQCYEEEKPNIPLSPISNATRMFRDKYLMTLYAELDDLLIRMGKVLGFHSQRSTDTMDANGFLILCYKEKMQEQGYHHHPTKSDHRPKGTMRCPTLHQSWNITNLVTKLMDRQTILKSRNAIADYRLPRTLERVVYLYGDGSNTAKCSSSISWTSSSNSVQGWDSEAPKNSTYGMGEGLNIRSRHGDKELVQPVRKIVDKFVEMLHMLYPSTSHPKEKTVPIGAMRSITWQQFPFDQMERSSIPRFTVSSLFGMKLFTSSSVANDTLTGIIKQINLQAIVRGDLMLVFPTTLSNSNASSLYHSQIHRRKKNNQTTGTCLLGEEEEDVQNLFEKIEHVVQAILMVKPSTSCRIDR